jgi:hypothetical protein
MKKAFILLLAIIVFTACKNDSKTENQKTVIDAESSEKTTKQNDGLTLLVGDFIYYADAAVLQTHNEVYGVVIDEKVMELNKQAKQHKKEPTDMVMVSIRGKISPKPNDEEGWPYRVEIKEILSVKPLDSSKNDVIKIGNN